MGNKHILIADDEPLTRKSLYELLRFEGYNVSLANDGEEALQMVKSAPLDLIIADLKMPKVDGLELLKRVKEINPEITVVLITGYGSIETAVEAMKLGAFDYITKPIIDNEIKLVIQRIFEQKRLIEENRALKEKLDGTIRTKFYNIVGRHPKMQKIYNLIEVVAPTNATVLIQGESGTGKQLIAHALHYGNPLRKDRPFVEVSCGALPENLLESELFGHVKGSFTTAIRDRKGRFESANGGTIFLDEIDTFSPKLQVKLLRVLQQGEFERVGDSETIKVDVRVIAATNQDLTKLIKNGMFREDLYYRLNVVPILVPPLRERDEDILLLAEYFLDKYREKIRDKKIESFSSDVKEIFLTYDWPGNVRELENVIERAIILCKGNIIEKEDLPDSMQEIKVSTAPSKITNLSLKE
ncbi:MAG: sigma-54 dependent transcriptional regulator, partial [Candidatus Omnitrophica bacterium]|nr:sigma-54 dependent transcriptional regulator [Candidatus Omnitrophota bacterium]